MCTYTIYTYICIQRGGGGRAEEEGRKGKSVDEK